MPVLAPSRRGGKRLAKKAKRKQEALHDLVQICVLLLVVVLICTFWNVSDSLADPELETDISGFGQQSSQSQFIASYTRAREQDIVSAPMIGRTEVDLSGAYVDASSVVPAYNQSSVQKYANTEMLYSVGSPTGSYDSANAFVVNYSILLEQEYEDIKAFETNVLGVDSSKYSDTSDYIQKYARVDHCISLGHYSHKTQHSNDIMRCAVGPAILVRDWYTMDNVAEVFSNTATACAAGFSGASSYADWYVDLMLVPDEDSYTKYMSGDTSGVTVTYVRFNGTPAGGKAHFYPWGLNQTFIGRSTNMGGLGTCYAYVNNQGGVSMTDEAVKYTGVYGANGAENLKLVYNAARESGKWAYWFPSLEAQMSDYDLTKKEGRPFGASVETYRAFSQTAGLFETHAGECNNAFRSGGPFEGYYLVGVLVYADSPTWVP